MPGQRLSDLNSNPHSTSTRERMALLPAFGYEESEQLFHRHLRGTGTPFGILYDRARSPSPAKFPQSPGRRMMEYDQAIQDAPSEMHLEPRMLMDTFVAGWRSPASSVSVRGDSVSLPNSPPTAGVEKPNWSVYIDSDPEEFSNMEESSVNLAPDFSESMQVDDLEAEEDFPKENTRPPSFQMLTTPSTSRQGSSTSRTRSPSSLRSQIMPSAEPDDPTRSESPTLYLSRPPVFPPGVNDLGQSTSSDASTVYDPVEMRVDYRPIDQTRPTISKTNTPYYNFAKTDQVVFPYPPKPEAQHTPPPVTPPSCSSPIETSPDIRTLRSEKKRTNAGQESTESDSERLSPTKSARSKRVRRNLS